VVTAIRVLRPGLLTTVQDLGRWGSQAIGVPVGGPMDVYAHRLANLLVANDASLATLEATLIGPELEFETDAVVAITGAVFEVQIDGVPAPHGASFRIRRGQHLRFGRRRLGARAYIGVAGGVDTPVIAGSRATNVTAAIGGHQGRALVGGDRLPVGQATAGAPVERRVAGAPATPGRTVLRILSGPQEDWFPAGALERLCRETYRISPRSNRMGYRLEGVSIPRVPDRESITEAVPMGAIQVPSAGEPILLMADRQTAGGYPKIATVISADLCLAGQLAPGDTVDFRVSTWQEALSALITRERQMLQVTERGALV
jgi:antagonist of KipI